jgi:hypothetical protein
MLLPMVKSCFIKRICLDKHIMVEIFKYQVAGNFVLRNLKIGVSGSLNS